MRSTTLPATDVQLLGDLAELATGPRFASLEDVQSAAAVLAGRVGLARSSQVGHRYFLRVSPGTVGLRCQMVWDATEGYAGRRAQRAVKITRGPWAGRWYAGESAGYETARQARVDGVFAAEADRAARAIVTEHLAVAEIYEPDDLSPGPRRITEWSRRSRSRMAERVAELDYSDWMAGPGLLGMITYSLPMSWSEIAPQGRVFKDLVRRLRDVWRNARDENGEQLEWRGLWKLELQRRGAPHLHTLMKVPALVNGERFETWIARTWTEVVGADDVQCHRCHTDQLGYDAWLGYGELVADRVCGCGSPDTERRRHSRRGTDVSFSGVKYSDPRRTAIYFSKHASKSSGSKEYQHVVPELWQEPEAGPGRFWGYWGLRRAVAEVEVDLGTFHAVRRILRHVGRARQSAVTLAGLRAAHERAGRRAGQVLAGLGQMKRPRRRGGLGAAGGGWVLVNDGISLVLDVGRHLAVP